MAVKLLAERFGFTGTVGSGDKSNVIENVPFCGPVSANHRRYLVEAFAGNRINLYNGRPVYINHGKGADGRPYQELIGVTANARHTKEGMPFGDVVVNPEKPYGKAILWDAKHQPKICGMSHVARCETRRAKDGWEEITEILEVESVDIVTDPATTSGLQENRGSRTVAGTIKELVTWVKKHPKSTSEQIIRITKLSEMVGMGDVACDPPADDADSGDGVKSAFKSAINSVLDSAECFGGSTSDKEVLGKIKELMTSHGKVSGAGGGKSAPSGDDDEPTPESKLKKPDPNLVLKECKDAGYDPSTTELGLLFETADPAKRILYVREQLAKVAESNRQRPESGGRKTGGGPPTQRKTEAKAPAAVTDVKSFVSAVTG